MRVKCKTIYPDDKQLEELGEGFYRNQAFYVTPGGEYTVYDIIFTTGQAGSHGTGTWIEMVSDYGHLRNAPLLLFEIVDGRVSRYWERRTWPHGEVTFRPASLYREYYHDDLSEGVPEVVADFQ